MAVDYLLKVEGPKVDGEATQKGYEKQIVLFSYSFGVSQPGGYGMGGSGQARGRAQPTDLSYAKKVDDSTPLLYGHCCTGTHFDKITLTALKDTDTGRKPYFTAEMTKCMITGLNTSGGSGGDDVAMESGAINFSDIKFTFHRQNEKGAMEKGNEITYDFKTAEKK
jgi:type VI secretion system secreted protein Hcp